MGRSAFFNSVRKILGESFRNELAITRVSRREALKSAGIMTVGAAVAQIPFTKRLDDWIGTQDSVAIVGAGAAGLTAAYQLKKYGIPFVIYESSSRVGGRVFTDYGTFKTQGQYCELGGELIDTGHESIRSLARELKLEVVDLPQEDMGLYSDIFIYKGRRYTEEDIKLAAVPLIRAVASAQKEIYLSEDEEPFSYKNSNPAAIKYDRMNVLEWFDTLGEIEPWLRRMVEIAYVSEFGISAERLSALSLIQMFPSAESEKWQMYGESDEISRIKGGNQKLIEALYASAGGEKHLRPGHRLVQVRDRLFGVELTFNEGGKTKSYRHGQVIMTLPLPVLKHVEGFSYSGKRLEMRPEKFRAIHELAFGDNSKLMLGFTERTWRAPDAGRGSCGSVTADGYVNTIWETSRMQPGEAGILTHFLAADAAKDIPMDVRERTLRDIDDIFPGTGKRHNGLAVLMNWPSHPCALGSYCSLSVGQLTSLFGLNGESELRNRILFAGDHASLDYYGYMEGAVQTGMKAAESVYRLRRRRNRTLASTLTV